mmetsp:Transcript_67914/g.136657  ORF Transcript_67914/g.136657 Transcript_67914/m.136657 type:complete len:200 (-) Transcript_67914:321-920(-)
MAPRGPSVGVRERARKGNPRLVFAISNSHFDRAFLSIISNAGSDFVTWFYGDNFTAYSLASLVFALFCLKVILRLHYPGVELFPARIVSVGVVEGKAAPCHHLRHDLVHLALGDSARNFSCSKPRRAIQVKIDIAPNIESMVIRVVFASARTPRRIIMRKWWTQKHVLKNPIFVQGRQHITSSSRWTTNNDSEFIIWRR